MAREPWDLGKAGSGNTTPAYPTPSGYHPNEAGRPAGAGGSGVPADPGDPDIPTGPASPTDPASPGIRASDEDRSRTADWLCWAAGTGQLSLDEADGRLVQAYAARTLDELATLTADLQPKPAPAPPAEPKPPLRDRLLDRVPVDSVVHLVPFLLVALFLLMLAVSDGRAWFPWPIFVLGFIFAKRHRYHHPHGGRSRPARHDR
jgi:Domain of unknown function (DUF1707)